jgi:hypothetical protein
MEENVNKILILDYTPTHQNTNLSRQYNLSQVQRELDFTGSLMNNNCIPIKKFNINPNKTPSSISRPFASGMNSTAAGSSLFSPSNNVNNIKSFSFVANNNIKSPTAIKYNVIDFQARPLHQSNTFTDNVKFSLNNKNEENLDHKINLENVIIGKDKRTTLMLRNIPNKYTLQNLVEEINPSFLGKYDYINLPIDYERKLNLGYAFINFVDPMHIVMFFDTYYNKKWSKYRSDKVFYYLN